jgi:DNA-binding MarR family transcriptional regulator
MTTREQEKWQANVDGIRGMAQWITICQTYNAVYRLTELVLLPHGLSVVQFHLLSILKGAGGSLATGEIGRVMVRQSKTLTGLVDRLEEPGLVERVFDRRDRRKIWVRLTEEGVRKLEEVFPVVTGLTEELLSGLSGQERGQLQATVEKLGRAATILSRKDYIKTNPPSADPRRVDIL